MCIVREERCSYTTPSKRRKLVAAEDWLNDRVDRLETLIKESTVSRITNDKNRTNSYIQNNAAPITQDNAAVCREQGILAADEVRYRCCFQIHSH